MPPSDPKEPILEPIVRRWRFQKIISHIKPNSVVVDIGCGHIPRLLNSLAKHINHGVAIDPLSPLSSAKNIKVITRKLDNKIPLPTNLADHVTLAAVLEHLENPQGVLSECLRILKKNGTLILTTPTPLNKPLLEFLSFRLGLISPREIEEHKRYYLKNNLISLAKEIGFKNIRHQYFELFLNNFLIAQK